jgi:hypothetical protein
MTMNDAEPEPFGTLPLPEILTDSKALFATYNNSGIGGQYQGRNSSREEPSDVEMDSADGV